MHSHHNAAEFILAGKDPGRTALETLTGAHTYGELERRASGVARFLSEKDVEKDGRIILAAENSLFWAASYLGIMRAGLVCVPIPPAVAERDLAHIMEATRAKIAFVDARFAVRNANLLRDVHLATDRKPGPLPEAASQTDFTDLDEAGSAAGWPVRSADRDDLAALMFTSGTTGRPRGVMVSHRNIMSNTESIIQSLSLTEQDRMMTVLPFYYCFGTSLLHTHLRAGGSLVLDSRFQYPETILQRMAQSECTGFAGVPSHYQILLRNSDLRNKTFPRLRYLQQAGGSLAPSFIRELRQALPNVQVFIMYGQTEATARLSCLPPEHLDAKLGSVGKAIPGVKLRVLNESGADVLPGETGEIVAEGDNIARGYWGEPAESAATFRDGKLYTGDVATVDADGFLYIVDRLKDFLKCGGQRVSCRQIEERLVECEELIEAAVVGVPDDVLGEAVRALVVPRDNNAPDLVGRLRQFCRERLPAHLVPKEIVVVPALAKNASGKVIRESLERMS